MAIVFNNREVQKKRNETTMMNRRKCHGKTVLAIIGHLAKVGEVAVFQVKEVTKHCFPVF